MSVTPILNARSEDKLMLEPRVISMTVTGEGFAQLCHALGNDRDIFDLADGDDVNVCIEPQMTCDAYETLASISVEDIMKYGAFDIDEAREYAELLVKLFASIGPDTAMVLTLNER